MLFHILDIVQHYVLPFVLVISVVVFVHEFGHYWVARRCGVKIETFSIGFGPEIFGWTDGHGTRWSVACLPFGGYVKMYGDSNAASMPGSDVPQMTAAQKKVSFHHQSVDKRMAIVAAGPAVNYLFAILVLAFLFVIQGQPYTSSVISAVLEGSAAAKVGIQKNDRVVSVDNQTVERFEDIKRIVSLNSGTPIPLEVERGAKHIRYMLTPDVVMTTDRFGGEHRIGRLGITSSDLQYKIWSPGQAVRHAVIEVWDMTTSTFKALGQIIIGTRGGEDLGGPLRIAQISGQVATDGILSLVWLMAVISVNLGLINLFPVPLLDGGHLVFYIAERLRGKPVHDSIQEMGARIGAGLVVSLMLFATWNDLVHLKVISYLKGFFS